MFQGTAMVGINLTSEELQTIFNTLGLNENESQVYVSLLSLGTLTLGQISQLPGLNYIQARDAIEISSMPKLSLTRPRYVCKFFNMK
jgi:hypothetical protein